MDAHMNGIWYVHKMENYPVLKKAKKIGHNLENSWTLKTFY